MTEATAPAEGVQGAEQTSEAAEAGKLRRRLTLTAIATAVGLVAAGVGLAFDLHPGWRPDPETQLDATMTAGPMESHVTLREYLRRVRRSPTAEQQPVLGIWGDVVYVRQQTDGLKHRRSFLTWYLYNAKTGRRVPSSFLAGHVRARASTPSDTIVVPVWVQPPPDAGRYFLRFELAAKGVLLAVADSPSFPNCRSRGCGASGR